MFRKKTQSNEYEFYYPLNEAQRATALKYIEQNGALDFISKTNLECYVPNIFPFGTSQKKVLSALTSEQVLTQIDEWIYQSILTWDNVPANTIHNQQVNTAKLAYKGQQYGTQFLLGDMDALPQNAFVFPLLEDEMYLALDVIEKKGIGFFVEHCAELPDSGYNRDTQEETIANMESLLRQYGAYWLLGQLNTTAILAVKGYSVR